MAETHVLFALKRCYARTLGVLHAAHGDRIRTMADLDHLAAVIRMFNPNEDLLAIRPRRPYKPNRERWSRTALGILRASNSPLRARELARLVMSKRGVNPNDHARMPSISCGLQAVLGRLADQGLISISGKPRRWAIAIAGAA